MDGNTIVGSPFNRNSLLYGKDDVEMEPKNIGPACVDRHGENVREAGETIHVTEPKEKPARPC